MTSTAKNISKLLQISTPYVQQRVIGDLYTHSMYLKIPWGRSRTGRLCGLIVVTSIRALNDFRQCHSHPFRKYPSPDTLWTSLHENTSSPNLQTPKLREDHIQESYFFNLLVVLTAHYQSWFVENQNCVQATSLDDR